MHRDFLNFVAEPASRTADGQFQGWSSGDVRCT